MQVFIFIIVFHLLVAQNFTWEKIEAIPEGYQYVINSNDNRGMVEAGV